MAERPDRDGRIPLHYAALENRVDEVRRLISDGSDVNAQDNSGKTPLAHARAATNDAMVTWLLARGAR